MNECQHTDAPIRAMRTKGGTIQFKRQCQACWQSVGPAIAKASIPGADSVPPFDDEARKGYWEERGAAWKRQQEARQAEFEREAEERALEQEEADAAWRERYAAYLRTDRWQAKRRAVFERCQWRCEAQLEGCTGRADQVHHLRYTNMGDEPLWDLVGICYSCHSKFDGTKLNA